MRREDALAQQKAKMACLRRGSTFASACLRLGATGLGWRYPGRPGRRVEPVGPAVVLVADGHWPLACPHWLPGPSGAIAEVLVRSACDLDFSLTDSLRGR